MIDECDKKHDNLVAISYEYIQHPYQNLGGKEDNYCFSERKQKVLSPLSKDEIDQLLKGHVTT